MSKRWPKSFWTRAMQRNLTAMTRSALRSSKKALKLASTPVRRKPKARGSAAGKDAHWHAGLAVGLGGAKRYHLYKPPAKGRKARKMALVVMLHGCGQDALGFAASTRMNRLAAAAGDVMVLYPEQDRMSNPHGCWNWFDTRSGHAQREAASIMASIDQICLTHPVDPLRIVVAGLSAGAGMAALLALSYPHRFAAVAMHSGVGPGLAHSSATALAAMRGHAVGTGQALPPPLGTLPALLVIHGGGDGVVAPVNGALAAQRWAAMAPEARPGPMRDVQRGKRLAAKVRDWKVGRRVVVTLAEVTGLGHAWSGGSASQAFSDPAGPDASRMLWAFAQRAFAAREQSL